MAMSTHDHEGELLNVAARENAQEPSFSPSTACGPPTDPQHLLTGGTDLPLTRSSLARSITIVISGSTPQTEVHIRQ